MHVSYDEILTVNEHHPNPLPDQPSQSPVPPAPPVGSYYSNQSMYPNTPQTDNNAIIGLIFGILGISTCALLAIPAIIMGYQAKRSIRESNGMKTGEGIVTATIVLGFIGIALALLQIAYLVFFFRYMRPS